MLGPPPPPPTSVSAWEVDLLSHVDDASGGLLVATAARAPEIVALLGQARDVRGGSGGAAHA